MNKHLQFLLISIFLLLAFFWPAVSYSQTSSTFDSAYQEYSLGIEGYNKAHGEYVLARSQYIKFQTLTSKNNAKDATLVMLQTRDEVLITYIKTLKEKLKDTKGIPDATREASLVRLDNEMNWFTDHKDKLTSAGSLEDLVADSDEASKKYETMDPLIYEILTIIASGKINGFRDRLNDNFTQVREKVNNIREEEDDKYKFSTRKLEVIDRWIFETENRITRSQEKQAESEVFVEQLAGLDKKGSTQYGKAVAKLGESQQYLREASLFVREIIREIKTAE